MPDLKTLREQMAKDAEPLAKASSSYAGGGDSSVKEQNDPAQQKTTESEVDAQRVAQASGDSAVASNLALLRKSIEDRAAALKDAIQKVEGPLADEARALIEKAGPATAKLEEVKSLLKIDDSKLRDEYDLRWKISELVCVLQQAAKVEEILSGTEKSEEKSATAKSDAWPRDMASAGFDQKAGIYKADDPSWGHDPAS